MRAIADGTLAILVLAVWCAEHPFSGVAAQEAKATVLTAETVRSDYDARAENWMQIPDLALDAVVAAEDPSFYSKPAQDSTITIQLGKRYIRDAMRAIDLRLLQTYNANTLAQVLTHEEILAWYSQEIWLGYGCSGLPAAAKAYFASDLMELEVHEVALLAALIQSPAKFDPVRAPNPAKERRNRVIDQMSLASQITATEASEAVAAELGIQVPVQRCGQE